MPRRRRALPAPLLRPLGRAKRMLWSARDELILALDLGRYRVPAAAERTKVSLEEPAGPEESARLVASIDPSFAEMAQRFAASGFRCFACRVDGAPAGYIWWHDHAAHRPHPALRRLGIQLQPGDVYLFNLLLPPGQRRPGVAGAFFARVLTHLRDLGYARAYGFVESELTPARWMYAVHGWKTVDRFRGRIVCGLVLLSQRGLFVDSNLVGRLRPRRREAIREFVPVRSSRGGATR